jgi:hypothetical protein
MPVLTSQINAGRISTFKGRFYVEIWRKNEKQNQLLGAVYAEADGKFSINYEDASSPVRAKSDLVFAKVYSANELVKDSSDKPVAIVRNSIPAISITPNRAGRMAATQKVTGNIASTKGKGLPNLLVRAFDKTLKAEVFLSEAITNEKGDFVIYYQLPGAPKLRTLNSVDLILKAYKDENSKEPLIISPVVVNALPAETINLAIGEGSYKEEDSFSRLQQVLDKAIDGANINELSERDVFILSNKNDLELNDVSYYIQSLQWSALKKDLPAEIYFAWFKAGLASSWADLLAVPLQKLKDAVTNAITENLVPESAVKHLPNMEKIVKSWRTDMLITAKGQRLERASVGDLLAKTGLDAVQKRKLMDDWQSESTSVENFWEAQKKSLGEKKFQDLQLTLQLGAVTRNHIPLIESLKTTSKLNRVQQLAAMQETDWLKILEDEKLTVPDDIPGEDMSKKRKTFASQLRAVTETLVPTAVLAHEFKADKNIESSTLNAFLDKNPDFEFRSKTIKTFLKENPEALAHATDRQAAQKELEAVQRIFHLTPSKDKARSAKKLWQHGLHSAFAIKMNGVSFLKEIMNDDGLAQRIYDGASMKQSQAGMLKMQLHSMITPSYTIVPGGIAGLTVQLGGDADLEALFGDQGYCACKHCDSFFSPSAYLTDLFLYLHKVKVNVSAANPDLDTALEKLFKRRPDLGNIQLDCENSHTPLPYIDLVNEVLEMSVVPLMYQYEEVNIFGKKFTLPMAKVPQTESSAAVLKAYPQHIKKAAYNNLIEKNNETLGFPWILPFNLWMLELRTYLNHLGVSRADLMRSILGAGTSEENIATEYLDIIPEEKQILNEAGGNAFTTQRYWGTSRAQLEKVPVFLKQTGYSYKKLLQLLELRYIPAINVVFTPASSCLVSDAAIENLTDQTLQKIHKFGRLLQRTNDDVFSLDRTIMAFGGEINSAFLIHYAGVLEVGKQVKSKVERRELLSWWNGIDRKDYKSSPSLHTKLFMEPERIPQFLLDNNEFENPGQVIDATAAPLDPDLLAPILSATKLKATDIQLLVSAEFPGNVITFNFSQISYLYATASFCRAMKLKMTDYLAMKNLLGFQPVSSPGSNVQPAQTLRFIRKLKMIKDAGFEPEMLNYILRHESRSNAPFALSETEIEKILKQLQAALVLQLKEVFPTGTTTKEKVASKLRLIFATATPEDIEKLSVIEQVIAATSSLPVAEQAIIVDEQLVFFKDKQDAKNKLVNGGLQDPEARLLFALQAIDNYLLENIIVQQLSDAIGLPQKLTIALLQKLLSHPSVPANRAIDIYLAENFINADATTPWSMQQLADAFTIVARLHKIKLIADTLDLKLPDIEFLMRQPNTVTGLPDFNALPVTASVQPPAIDNWLMLFNLVLLNRNVFPEEQSVFTLLGLINDNTVTKQILLQQLNSLTGWKLEDLDFLTGPDSMNLVYSTDFAKGDWLVAIGEAIVLIDRVGATARQMASWASANVNKTQADAVRHAAMAKYGEEQWQTITVPLRNNIREAQRNALVQYVLHYGKKASGASFEDIDDIYAYFLIDTQMAACTDTSRIVLAASSVQLFVQRIMMNLEIGMSVNQDFMKEWKWRKYYRVWEANRKVFMWPENWIEPELRDDKTELFEELESELMQGELSTENIEKSYVSYLEKLHEVSHLKVVGSYQHENTFHVIARTQGTPEKFFYRRWENRSEWTSWEKIELDIFNGQELEGSEHGTLILPVMHNRKLFLFWPVFKQKKEPPTTTAKNLIKDLKTQIDDKDFEIRTKDRLISKYSREIDILKERVVDIEQIDEIIDFVDLSDYVTSLGELIKELEGRIANELAAIGTLKSDIRGLEEEIREYEQGLMRYVVSIAWSQYRDGFWTPKKMSVEEVETPVFKGDYTTAKYLFNYALRPLTAPDGNLHIYIYYMKNFIVPFRFSKPFVFNDCQSVVETGDAVTSYALLPRYNLYYMDGVLNNLPLTINDNSGKEVLLLQDTHPNSRLIRSLQFGFNRVGCPFFFQDKEHSFFVSPPSSNILSGITLSFAGASSLRSGTNLLQGSSYRLLGDDVGGTENRINTDSDAAINGDSTGRNYYGSSNSNQVIVRDKAGREGLMAGQNSFAHKPDNNFQLSEGAQSMTAVQQNGYTFYLSYHPYTCLFLKELNRYGIDGLLAPVSYSEEGKELLYQATPSQMTVAQFQQRYQPNLQEVIWGNVKEEVDFKHGGYYSTYNWEVFYHIPLFIATRLSQDLRFDEAQKWFHYIFDPTEPVGEVPYRFWKIKPFHTYTIQQIKNDMEAVMKGGEAIKKQIEAWEANPFNPHLLARFRRLAYMKTVVMKYLDNLIAWGDQLFRMDTIESMNEATQLYVLAGQILGKMPVETEGKTRESKTFNELASRITAMGNAWVELENELGNEYEYASEDFGMVNGKFKFEKFKPVRKMKAGKIKTTDSNATNTILDDILYFCMSPNEKLLSYWDTVADRLFKLRNCMNIEGLIRSVPLFQPPIDPALLVKAVAAGVDINSAINDLYAPTPYYRFQTLIQKAQQLAGDLKSLGGMLLSTLEKKDAEQLALVKSQHEIQLLEANKDIRKHQIDEARLSVASLEETYKLSEIRHKNYSDRDFISSAEAVAMILSTGAAVFQVISAATATAASVAAQVPDIELSTHAQAMSSGASVKIHPPASGDKNEKSAMSMSKVFEMLAIISRDAASNVSTVAGYERRMEDWELQIDMADQEMRQVKQQILGAMVREKIAEKEKDNLDLQIENSKQAEAYMKHKYTNQELYNWLTGQISTVYFQTYKMAHDMAKQAEKAFRFELGIENSNFIQFGYWDNLRKGLLSGEKLSMDISRLELAYLEKNKRDYEITKHVSLSQLDPLALVSLRASGLCEFEIPEVIFDLDYPGHFFRRIKSVSISIPCIAGPYASISARLSILNNKYRKNTNTGGSGYAEELNNDGRFVYNVGAIQSIATSSAQNDSGVFEINFRDERYLPFEGTGAVSKWSLDFPAVAKQFDYNTISDVIIHIKYTAREGGMPLKQAASNILKEQMAAIKQSMGEEGLHTAINVRHDLPNEWHLLKQNGTINLTIDKARLPYVAQAFDITIEKVIFLARSEDSPAISIDGTEVSLGMVNELALFRGEVDTVTLVTAFSMAIGANDKINLQQLIMVVKYRYD